MITQQLCLDSHGMGPGWMTMAHGPKKIIYDINIMHHIPITSIYHSMNIYIAHVYVCNVM